jgi:hypothetical protein
MLCLKNDSCVINKEIKRQANVAKRLSSQCFFPPKRLNNKYHLCFSKTNEIFHMRKCEIFSRADTI